MEAIEGQKPADNTAEQGETLRHIVRRTLGRRATHRGIPNDIARSALDARLSTLVDDNKFISESYNRQLYLQERALSVQYSFSYKQFHEDQYDFDSVLAIVHSVNQVGTARLKAESFSYGRVWFEKVAGHLASVMLPVPLAYGAYAVGADGVHIMENLRENALQLLHSWWSVPGVSLTFAGIRMRTDYTDPLERLYRAAVMADDAIAEAKSFVADKTNEKQLQRLFGVRV